MTESTPKIALVTGASRGLGRSAALKLAGKGLNIILTYKENVGSAHSTLREIEALGSQAVALQLDTANSRGFDAFSKRVEEALQQTWRRRQFDYLVNNAGNGVNASLAETTEEQFDMLANTHLKGTFFLTQRLASLIADGGSIVNISSGLTRFTFPGYGAYAAMKGGMEVLTRYMAAELASRRITVNTIAPGAIETDFRGGFVRDNAEVNAQLASVTALGRVGLPDDVGGAVAALLSDANGWITGQRIEVSGGMML